MKTISRILTSGKILTIGGAVCLFGSFALADTLNETNSATLPTNQVESQSDLATSRNVRLNKSIVTAASGSEKLVKDAPASTTVISQEELQTMPYRDLAEAVRNVPGVEIDASAGKLGGFSFLIRGMPADYTLLLVDGRRTKPGGQIATNNNGMESMYNAFMPPLSAIEKIEVIRGPMSTLYGSDAMGGMVNIVTKKIPEKWGATLSLEANIPESKAYQSTFQASFYAAGALSKSVGMNFRLRDLYRSEAGNTFKTNDGNTTTSFFGAQSNAYNIGTRLNYTPDSKNTFIFDVDYTKITFDNRKAQIGRHTAANKDNNGLTGGYTDYMNVSKLVGLLGHDGDYSFGKWKTSLQYMDTRNLGRKVVGKYTADPDVGKSRDIIGQDIYLDSRLLLPLGDYNNLNVGAEYRSEQMHDRAANPNRFGFHTISAFVEDEWNIFEPFTITLGLRDTYNTKFGNHISPRIYGVLDITDSLTLKGGVSTGYKTPYTNQLVSGVYGYGSQGALGFLGNPDLKPETSINYELGLVFDNDYVDFSITGFRNNFSNKITSQKVTSGEAFNTYCGNSIYANGCNQLYNADTAYTQGVESTFGIKPIYGVGFDISYVWTDTEVTSGKTKGQKLSFIPEHSLNAKLSYAYKDFSAYLRTEYKAKTPNNSFYSNTNKIAYKEYYKDYVVLTLGAQYRINDFVRLNAGIYNLLNHSFIDFDNVAINGNTATYANNYRFILDGRRYWLNVTLDF